MAREDYYKAQLIDLGTYRPAFDTQIHQLCVLEREISRARKEWKATAKPNKTPSMAHPLYRTISELETKHHERLKELGLTVKSHERMVSKRRPADDPAPAPSTGNAAFSSLMDQLREAANGSTP